MKIYRILSTLLALIVIACLFGVQGQFQEQYVTPSNGYSASSPSLAQNPAQFSPFYTMPSGPAPSNPIGAPQPFEIAGNPPSTLYFGEQMQLVPYSQYQSNPAYTGANSLWIKGATAWTQYAVVPQGATVSLLAISPMGGNGALTTDGLTYSNNYVFYPNSLLTFYAGTIGRHTLSFAINGQSSNQVVIDVTTSTYNQPSNYPPSTNYYPGYNSWDYYPWDYYPGYYLPSTNYYPGYNSWDHKVNTGPGNDHKVNTGPGNDHKVNTGPGNDHKVNIGPGNDHKVNTGPGNDHKVNTGPGNDHKVNTGPGNDHSGNTGQDLEGWV